jgi:cytochrome bd ubiquinol oxidase subunit II
MTLVPLWFIILTVVWSGFFLLEGFDFGVGMLHGYLGKDERGRRAAINSIGPLWDGNEVWLIVAAAGTFAAFPGWYATMFSTFYPLMVITLAALIVRGVSFEFRGKVDSDRWRRIWDGLLTGGSLIVPLLLGVVIGDMLHGLPINSQQEFTGSFWDLLQPYGIFTGISIVAMCLLHGSTFLTLKTSGEVRTRAGQLARRMAPVTALIVLAFVIWTHVVSGNGFFPGFVEVTAVIAIVAAAWLIHGRHEGWAFTATGVAIAVSIVSVFSDLYPRVFVSSTNASYSLTVQNTAAGSYSLKAMTVVAAVFLPLVLVYTAWNYYVFRRRISPDDFAPRLPPARPPVGPDAATPATGPTA